MDIEKRFAEINTLIDLGRRKGFLLYDEVNDLLPTEITAPEEISALLEKIAAEGIQLSDEPLVGSDVDGAVGEDVVAASRDDAARAIRSGLADRAALTRAIESTLAAHTIGSIWLAGCAMYTLWF